MQKKRYLLIILALLLLSAIPIALALTTANIYSGTMHSGDVVEIDGSMFTFIGSGASGEEAPNLLSVSGNGTTFTIRKGDCKQPYGRQDLFACYNGGTYEDFNEDYNKRFLLSVSFSKVISSMEITREISKTNLLIGEKSTVTTTFRNGGNWDATDAVFVEEFPKEFTLFDVEGCNLEENVVIWRGIVSPTGRHTCSYRLYATEGIIYESEANITHFNGNEIITTSSPSTTFTIPNYALITDTKISKSTIDISEGANITINITNTNDVEPIQVTLFEINIPKELKVKRRVGIQTVIDETFRAGAIILDPNEAEAIRLEIEPKKLGNHLITHRLTYNIGGLVRKVNWSTNFSVVALEPTVLFSKPDSIKPGEKVNLRAVLENPSTVYAWDDVEVVGSTNLALPKIDKKYETLKPEWQTVIFDETFTAPEQPGGFWYTISLTYTSIKKEVITKEHSVFIEVEAPIAELEEPIAELPETPPQQGEAPKIELSIPPQAKINTFLLFVNLLAVTGILFILSRIKKMP
jgi:hypothetical protein